MRDTGQRYVRQMTEFIDCFYDKFKCEPKSLEQQIDKRKKPVQRARIVHDTNRNTVEKIIRVFSKKEVSGVEPKPDRIISTMDQEHQLNWGSYTAALMEKMLEECPAMSFRSGKDVCHHVANVLDGKEYGVSTDFSRMDGNIGSVIRAFERRLIKRLWGDEALKYYTEYERGETEVCGK